MLGCYHPSQQNTFTGRVTPAMLDTVFRRAREYSGLGDPDPARGALPVTPPPPAEPAPRHHSYLSHPPGPLTPQLLVGRETSSPGRDPARDRFISVLHGSTVQMHRRNALCLVRATMAA